MSLQYNLLYKFSSDSMLVQPLEVWRCSPCLSVCPVIRRTICGEVRQYAAVEWDDAGRSCTVRVTGEERKEAQGVNYVTDGGREGEKRIEAKKAEAMAGLAWQSKENGVQQRRGESKHTQSDSRLFNRSSSFLSVARSFPRFWVPVPVPAGQVCDKPNSTWVNPPLFFIVFYF